MEDERRCLFFRFADPNGKYVRLPASFVDEWDEEIGNELFLCHSNGKMFRVGVVRKGNSVWLSDGWSSFKECNNLQYRDSLYFIHKGDNIFDYIVFGLNGVEKMARKNFKNKLPIHFYKKMQTGGFATKMVLPDDFTKLCGASLKNPMKLVHYIFAKTEYEVEWKLNAQPEYITMVDGWGDFVELMNIKKNDILIFSYDYTNEMIVDVARGESGMIENLHSEMHGDCNAGHNRVVESFSITITEGSADNRQPLYLPAPFVKAFLMNNPKAIRVKVPTGEHERWNIIYSVERKETKIGLGWYTFNERNKLEEGDVVTFVKKGDNFYEVKIMKMGD